MSRRWRTVSLVVVSMVVAILGLVAFLVVYWVPRSEDLATERAKTATPVGTATFSEVIRDPDQYTGRVLTLEGIVDTLWGSASVGADPTDTTVYPPPDAVAGTVVKAAYYPEHHPWVERDFSDPRSLVLSFLEPVPSDVHEGNTVRVVCRIIGERGAGFLETALDADICRELVVIDDSTYEWSDELRSASEQLRLLAQDSVLNLGDGPRPQFEVGEHWSLDPFNAFCEGSRTAVGHDVMQTFVPADQTSIARLEALWNERGLDVSRFARAGDLTAGHATLLLGELDSIGTIMLQIDGDRYVLRYETECL